MRWPGHRFVLGLFVSVLIVWAAAMAAAMRSAALPDDAPGPLLAVFKPGMSEDALFAAVVRAGGEPVRATWLPFVWVVGGREQGLAGRLKANGAIGAYSELSISPSLAGCFAYADAEIAELFTMRP